MIPPQSRNKRTFSIKHRLTNNNTFKPRLRSCRLLTPALQVTVQYTDAEITNTWQRSFRRMWAKQILSYVYYFIRFFLWVNNAVTKIYEINLLYLMEKREFLFNINICDINRLINSFLKSIIVFILRLVIHKFFTSEFG